ncbi:hypothetical protein [Chryseobacterium sp. Mn2064]|uniref:tetratricopeptide repeat protein n=1 Tax=Chryseobacterium sp. Mn2064 TaxID=3395263 RepID=UPI003BEF1A48
MNKIITILLLIFFSDFYFAQNSKKELDSLFNKKVKVLFSEGKLDESLVVCKQVIAGYDQLGDDKASLQANMFAASICSNLFRTKESLKYLDIASQKNTIVNDENIGSKITAEYGRNYKNIGFFDLALEYYDKAIDVARKEKNKKSLEYFYSLQSVVFEEQKKSDKFYVSLTKAHQSLPTVYNSARLAKYFLVFNKNLDSAKFYLDLGDKMASTNTFPVFQESILDRNWGRYFIETQDYRKAASYLEKSLEISKKLNKPQDIKDTHRMLADVYKLIGDYKKTTQSLEKYTVITDSLSSEREEIQHLPLQKIVKEKDLASKKSFNLLYLIIFAISIVFLIVYLVLRKRKQDQIKENEVKIHLKEEENRMLHQKVNEKFEDVIQLAKNNSPEFFTRFQEVYPQVIGNLLKLEPRMRVSELTLCAYIYLGFNTKDIANYTFRTISTVRNRKHNLRTKLNIPSEESTELWFKKLGQN